MCRCVGNDDLEAFGNPTISGDNGNYEPLMHQRPGLALRSLSLR